MKLSFSLPRATPDGGTQYFDRCVAIARSAEAIGIDAVSASDHPFPVVAPGRAGFHTHDPFVLLALIAGATERIRLHFSLIVLPYRNPFIVARSLATLDLASRGRIIAGLGAGYLEREFRALGANFEERRDAVATGIDAMTEAWTGEPVEREGAGWAASGNTMLPLPWRKPRPTLWLGGNTRTAMRLAVEKGDGWSPFEVNEVSSQQTSTRSLSLETLPQRMTALAAEVAAAERQSPLDVCYLRSSHAWLESDARIADELAQFAALGVTWLEFTVPGSEAAEIADGLGRFAAIARACDSHRPY